MRFLPVILLSACVSEIPVDAPEQLTRTLPDIYPNELPYRPCDSVNVVLDYAERAQPVKHCTEGKASGIDSHGWNWAVTDHPNIWTCRTDYGADVEIVFQHRGWEAPYWKSAASWFWYDSGKHCVSNGPGEDYECNAPEWTGTFEGSCFNNVRSVRVTGWFE